MARQAVAPTPVAPKGQKLQMVATRTGFYGNKRRKEGDSFTVTLREIDGKPEKQPSWALPVAEWKAKQKKEQETAGEDEPETSTDADVL